MTPSISLPELDSHSQRTLSSPHDASTPSHSAHQDSPSNEKEDDLSLQKTKSIAPLSLPREIAFISIVCLAQFTTQVGLLQTLSILRIIGAHYSITNAGTLSWLIAGYSLTVSSFILLSGRFGDVFGYKKLFVIGFAWFAVWSMVAGLAVYSNKVLFIFARLLQGIGPSICLPNGLALLGATYEAGNKKNLAFSLFGASAPVGAIVGGLFGAIFGQLSWWPWTFWSLALVLAVIAAASVVVIPAPPRRTVPEKTVMGLIWQLDLMGGMLGVTALILFNFAWNQAGVVGWRSAETIVTLILGVLLAPVFFWYENSVAKEPLIPFKAFSVDVAFVCACIVCGWGSFGVWVYYIWSFMEVLKEGSPLLATAWLSPLAISGALAAVTTGKLLGFMRPAWVMILAMSSFLIGTILLATNPIGQVYWGQLFVGAIIMPWGMDMSFPAATLILSNAVEKRHQGVAMSIINTLVNYSISIALGFAGTIEVNVSGGGMSKEQTLKGYRGALYFGVGMAGMGLAVSLAFLAKSYHRDAAEKKSRGREGETEKA